MTTQPIQLPWENETSLRWSNVYDFATRWRRTTRCVRRWCADGTLVRWGYRVYRDPQERWWIGEYAGGNNGTLGAISAKHLTT